LLLVGLKNLTHVEAKNAVYSAIKIADDYDENFWKPRKNFGQIKLKPVKF